MFPGLSGYRGGPRLCRLLNAMEKCKQKNIVDLRLRLLKGLFDHVEVEIRINGKMTKYVKMCIVYYRIQSSPLLFNVFIDKLLEFSGSKIKE